MLPQPFKNIPDNIEIPCTHIERTVYINTASSFQTIQRRQLFNGPTKTQIVHEFARTETRPSAPARYEYRYCSRYLYSLCRR